MNPRILRKKKRAVSSIIGGLFLFAMIFTVGFGFIYLVGQDNLFYQQAAKSNNAQLNQAGSEHLLVYGFSSSGNLGFNVNNTGITASLISYWIFNATGGALIQYQNITTLPSVLPHYIAAGASWNYTTGIAITSNLQRFIIKVLTARGSTSVGTYPSALLTSTAVNALVAGGFGSLQMAFTSFTWYDYKSGPPAQSPQYFDWASSSNCGYNDCRTYFNNFCMNGVACSGGTYTLDMAHPHPGSLTPEGYLLPASQCTVTNGGNQYNCFYNQVPAAFSVSITNDDPGLGTIVLNSESNIWVTETCDFGSTEGNCPNGNPVFVYYAANVNPTTGVVSSLNQGGFSQIVIPYGQTKTIYYASQFDLSLNSFNYVALSSFNSQGQQLSYYGQFAVFLLFSGTKISQQGIQAYGQNIPFESTSAADNLGWYSETPTTCQAGVQSSFQLVVNNSAFSNSANAINKIVLNASALTVATPLPTPPSGWTSSVSNGFITWTSGTAIAPGSALTFPWKGTPPAGAKGQQLILPLVIYWNGGTVLVQSQAEVCND